MYMEQKDREDESESGQVNADRIVSVSDRLQTLQEMFPAIDEATLCDLLTSHDWDLALSFEAALALNCVKESAASASKRYSTELQLRVSACEGTDREDSIAALSVAPTAEPLLAQSSSAHNLRDIVLDAGHSDGSGKEIQEQVKVSRRGRQINLGSKFLAVPRIKVITTRRTDWCTEYTVIFRKTKARLGIYVKQIGTDIYIQQPNELDTFDSMCLTEVAGIAEGDILVGIDGEIIAQVTTVKEVVEKLSNVGKYVSLQFHRRNIIPPKVLSRTHNISTIHPLTKALLDQEIVTGTMAEAMTKQIDLLKDRVIYWAGFVMIGLPQDDSSMRFGIIDSQMVIGGFEKPGAIESARFSSKSAFRFYTSTGLFRGSLQQDQNGFHLLLDQSIQRAKEASEYIGIVGQQLLSGKSLDDIEYPHDLLIENSPALLRRDKLERFEGLRPGLCVNIEDTKKVRNHIEYIIWVCDVQSGIEWRVSRRFRQFEEFHDLLLCIRPSLATFEFPPKNINTARDDGNMIRERIKILQKFLSRISSIISVNYAHPSTAKVQIALQNFLGIDEMVLKRFYAIELAMQKKSRFLIFRMIECYTQSIFCLRIMERVIDSFVGALISEEIDESDVSSEKSQEMLDSLGAFINNLQSIVIDSIHNDAKLIALSKNFTPECIKYLSESPAMIQSRAKSGIGGMMSFENLFSNVTSSDFDRFCSPDNESNSDSEEKDEGLLLIHSSEYDGKIKLLNELCGRNAEPKLDSSNGLKSGDIFPPDYLDKYLTTDVDFDRTTWVRNNAEDEIKSLIKCAVRRQVEIQAYLPSVKKLRHIIHLTQSVKIRLFRSKMLSLADKPQSFFGIPIHHISQSSWQSVVTILRRLDMKTIPFDRILILLEAANQIPVLFKKEHRQQSSSDLALGADDFLPIFIYVLVKSQILDIILINEEIQTLCDHDSRLSEAGYYLATLEASIRHILDIDVNSGEIQHQFSDESSSFADERFQRVDSFKSNEEYNNCDIIEKQFSDESSFADGQYQTLFSTVCSDDRKLTEGDKLPEASSASGDVDEE